VILIAFANLAFCGIIWNTGRMVLGAAASGSGAVSPAAAPRERSGWMVAGMLGCLFVVVALGVHVPGDLSALLDSARRTLSGGGQ